MSGISLPQKADWVTNRKNVTALYVRQVETRWGRLKTTPQVVTVDHLSRELGGVVWAANAKSQHISLQNMDQMRLFIQHSTLFKEYRVGVTALYLVQL